MAQYAFPSQANKSVKMTPRIPPKNGFVFTPGNVIRLEFPAQGYVNPMTTTLSFDVALVVPDPGFPEGVGPSAGTEACVRFQNNIQSIFSRVRLLYGANPIEDIINYNVVVRNLTEWTAGNPSLCVDQGTITDGIGNNTVAYSPAGDGAAQFTILNTRANMIHGCAFGRDTTPISDVGQGRGLAGFVGGAPGGVLSTTTLAWNNAAGAAQTPVPTIIVSRRYQVQLALGLLTQEKLIPTKYMASQLAIELTLDTPANCIVADLAKYKAATVDPVTSAVAGYVPGWQSVINYCVYNVNLIPEILEFDASYDTAFLQGLQNGGVPIKFSSWFVKKTDFRHTFLFSSANSSTVNLLIQERSRSVKSIFTVQRLSQPNIEVDNGATFFDTSKEIGFQTMQNYQYRVGGRYFPASPVQTSTTTGSGLTNGGAEAYIELAKALNILGDYRLSTACNINRWAYGTGFYISPAFEVFNAKLQNADYGFSIRSIAASRGVAQYYKTLTGGDTGSACFASAVSLETSNGIEISGLNAEEQVPFYNLF